MGEERVPKRFVCWLCGARCPKQFMKKGGHGQRQAWLRRHRERKHPELKAAKQTEAETE